MLDALRPTCIALLAGLWLCAPARAGGSNPARPSLPAPDKVSGDSTFEPIYRVLTDPRCKQLIEHMSFDPLVAWGWAPGGDRRPVEMPKDEFVRALQAWADAGAQCPSR